MGLFKDMAEGFANGFMSATVDSLRAGLPQGQSSRGSALVERLCQELGWPVDERQGEAIPGGLASAIAELIRTAPRSVKHFDEMPVTAFFFRITLEAQRLSPKDELFQSAMEYFGKHLIAMAPERRSMLEASVTGAMMGWVMG